MTFAPRAGDRRSAVRERHHTAILAAAAELMDQTGGAGFTVDELAARADVSRRTVFNHFPSMDDIVTAVCSDVLGAIVVSLEQRAASMPVGDAPATTLVDELSTALVSTDLVATMRYLSRVLGGDDGPSPRVAAMLLRASTEVGEALTGVVMRRHPDADPLQVHLLVGSVMSGLVVIHRHWQEATGAADDERSRRVWSALLDRLLATIRAGYGADPSLRAVH
ncbi:TetR/AcrR family transcriptional regulator [uncultured Cellulomonas sp.]|uniref:TetR/AcrR family transcriptional regulator n=1 Tax=uncultured Cellulomonas sp. TaxID=189682 RepID=UPI00261A560A|nr:TetR/AcrR family transcriptional regulator [uncultured Cellulomonas sp.]